MRLVIRLIYRMLLANVTYPANFERIGGDGKVSCHSIGNQILREADYTGEVSIYRYSGFFNRREDACAIRVDGLSSRND